jgi:hypothetical protein
MLNFAAVEDAMRQILDGIDYDIAKEYDPEYAFREDPDHPTYYDLASDFIMFYEDNLTREPRT